jgi:hypothetical protein
MLPYVLFILLTFGLSVFYDGQAEYTRTKKVWYIIVGIYLVLLAGFRNGVGGDTQLYMASFEYVPSTWGELNEFISDELTESGYMPGWSILVFLCKMVRLFLCRANCTSPYCQYWHSLSFSAIHYAHFLVHFAIWCKLCTFPV